MKGLLGRTKQFEKMANYKDLVLNNEIFFIVCFFIFLRFHKWCFSLKHLEWRKL